MEKLRVIQIGTKHDHASETYFTMRQLTELYEVAGWFEPDESYRPVIRDNERYQGTREFLSLEEVWSEPDVDVISVETEESRLTEYTLMAAERGYHVHMDKPGSPELTQFTKLIETCREKKLAFQIGYMYRYNPAILRALKLKEEGKLGDIISIEANMGCLHPQQKRQWLGQYKGGMLYFLGCHLIDLVYLFQGQPEKVIPLSCSTGMDGVTAEDYGAAVLCYKNGVSFVRTSAAETNGFTRRQFVISGTKATLELYPIEHYVGDGSMLDCRMKESYTEDAVNWFESGNWTEYEPFNRYKAMLSDYAAMARGEKENPFTLDYELAVQKLLLDACDVKYEA